MQSTIEHVASVVGNAARTMAPARQRDIETERQNRLNRCRIYRGA
ncbi:hypothetical protein [Burkholderia sola]